MFEKITTYALYQACRNLDANCAIEVHHNGLFIEYPDIDDVPYDLANKIVDMFEITGSRKLAVWVL